LTLAFCLDVDVRNVGFQLFVHLFVNSVVVVVLKMEIEEELMTKLGNPTKDPHDQMIPHDEVE